jgi:saccharopine dehydrogenase (NAD+, L-lysine-forming)
MHLWVRAESRSFERRVGLTPEGAKRLIEAGMSVTVEQSDARAILIDEYAKVDCQIAAAHSWPDAPKDAIIFGLKELPDDGSALPHRHIMFGHAYKGQDAGPKLLARFAKGGGELSDLEYLTDTRGRRVAAFGYWAGYTGAAMALLCWAAQQRGEIAGAVSAYDSAADLRGELEEQLTQCSAKRPTALIIGALGRVGTGAADLCEALGITSTKWDKDETAHGGPFPEILTHNLFMNCILASPQTPLFVGPDAVGAERTLSVISDIACDPDSPYNPIPIYSAATSWETPAKRISNESVLDVTAIDNLPSMLPAESSEDFAAQLLPTLLQLKDDTNGTWGRARDCFQNALRENAIV